jgi:hypothetical protein
MILPKFSQRLAFAALALYVGSYVVLSRVGYHHMKATDGLAFYYVEPTTPSRLQFHRFCRVLFFPIWLVDYFIGTGYPPDSGPERLSHLDRTGEIRAIPRPTRSSRLMAVLNRECPITRSTLGP